MSDAARIEALESAAQDILSDPLVRLVASAEDLADLTAAVAHSLGMLPHVLDHELAYAAEARWSGRQQRRSA